MISRRNIRVNVMQTLYAIDNINNEMGQPDRLKLLRNKINDSQNLLAYLIYFVTEIARFAETDAHQPQTTMGYSVLFEMTPPRNTSYKYHPS